MNMLEVFKDPYGYCITQIFLLSIFFFFWPGSYLLQLVLPPQTPVMLNTKIAIQFF